MPDQQFTHTHTHARARAHTHTHTHTRARARARTHTHPVPFSHPNPHALFRKCTGTIRKIPSLADIHPADSTTDSPFQPHPNYSSKEPKTITPELETPIRIPTGSSVSAIIQQCTSSSHPSTNSPAAARQSLSQRLIRRLSGISRRGRGVAEWLEHETRGGEVDGSSPSSVSRSPLNVKSKASSDCRRVLY